MAESDHIVAETAARIFADLADPQTLNRAKDDALEGAAVARARRSRADARLGAGKARRRRRASLADGFAILGAAGRFALPVPLAETLLAGWLLARAGHRSAGRADDRRAGAAARPHHAACRRHA